MSSEYVFEKRDPDKIKKATICLLIRKKENKTEILLAMKKRGFGVGYYNGPGGKPNEGESIDVAAIREVKEEIDIEIKAPDLVYVGLLHFYFPENKSGWDQDVYVFTATNWRGEPRESEEMKPSWFEQKDFPYANMWRDDPYWMPVVLSGRKIEAWFVFDEEEKLSHQKIIDLE